MLVDTFPVCFMEKMLKPVLQMVTVNENRFTKKKVEYQKIIFLDFTNKIPIKLVFTNKT